MSRMTQAEAKTQALIELIKAWKHAAPNRQWGGSELTGIHELEEFFHYPDSTLDETEFETVSIRISVKDNITTVQDIHARMLKAMAECVQSRLRYARERVKVAERGLDRALVFNQRFHDVLAKGCVEPKPKKVKRDKA